MEPLTAPDSAPRSEFDMQVRRIVWLLVGIGLLLRIDRYLINRSLWMDEMMLAWNIIDRPWRELLHARLLYGQAAPCGFLLLERCAITLFGTSEWALRIVPLLAGCASVFLFRAVAMRFLRGWGLISAMLLFVVVEPLVNYSCEVKQYGMDVAATLAVILMAMRWRAAREQEDAWITMVLVAWVAMFLSHAASLVIAGVGLALVIEALAMRDYRWLSVLVGVGVLIGVNGGLLYHLSMRHVAGSGLLNTYWGSAFMPYDLGAFAWLGRALWNAFTDYATLWLTMPWVAIACAAIGILALARRDRVSLALVALPIVATLAAAALHRYPFNGRLILFTAPLLILLMGAGVGWLESTFAGRAWVPFLAMLAVAGPSAIHAGQLAITAPGREETRPLLTYLASHRALGEGVYLYQRADVAWYYYGPWLKLADVPILRGVRGEDDPSLYNTEPARLHQWMLDRNQRRCWLFFTHVYSGSAGDEESLLLSRFTEAGLRILEVRQANGARIYHVEW